MSISTELLKKYSVPGPRYTSYPTVPYWEAGPTEDQWVRTVGQALEQSDRSGIGASLYVHIPFCRSICTYCGCNTRLTRDHAVVQPYLDAVIGEFDLYLDRLGRSPSQQAFPLAELHVGGGSPTFLSPDEMDRFFSAILSRVQLAGGVELSAEADPRTTTRRHLEVLAGLGFRRISFGVQDFDPLVQTTVNREQSENLVRQVTEWAREFGMSSVNYDLIYGLPKQTTRSIEMTMSAVRRLRPDRIAFYGNAFVPWQRPHQRGFSEEDLPDPEKKRGLYEFGRRLLEECGYREIGMDHFALEHDSLWKSFLNGSLHRNFMGYTPRLVAPLLGLGVSGIGDAWHAFVQNEKIPETYEARIAEGRLPLLRGHVLTREDRVLRQHILRLMTRFETSWEHPETFTPYLDEVAGRLEEMARDGLISLEPRYCHVNENGHPFLRNVCMAFDARLVRKAPTTRVFSQTV